MTPAEIEKIKWPETVTELHAHLGGSVPLYRLWEMGIEKGVRGIGKGYDDFISLIKIQPDKVKDLDSYLKIYDRIELIQSGPDALRQSIIIAIHGAFRTGGMRQLGPSGEGGDPNPLFRVARLELRFNPLKRTGAVFLKGEHAGLYDVDRVIKAACSAAEDVEIGFRGKIQVGFIFCFGRDMTFEANQVMARKIAEWKDRTEKIIGVDLAGPESVNPLNDPTKLKEMKSVFDSLDSKIGRTVHVGETRSVDIETFIKTIEALNPSRVAHPIVAYRAFAEKKDDRGFKLLKERGIVCELCVKSNLLTKALSNLEEYKKFINSLDDFDIPYTFSTDAPALQVTSLAGELVMLLSNDIVTAEQILRALKQADKSSFLPKGI